MASSPRLDAQKAFFYACREALRDGVIEATENRLLQEIRSELEVSKKEAVGILKHAKKVVKERAPSPGGGSFSRRRYLASLIEYASRKGTPHPADEALIERLIQRLKIDPETEALVRSKALERVQADPGDEAEGQVVSVEDAPPLPVDSQLGFSAIAPQPAAGSAENPPEVLRSSTPSSLSDLETTLPPAGPTRPSAARGKGSSEAPPRRNTAQLGGGVWAPWQVLVVGGACVIFSLDVVLALARGVLPKLNLVFAVGMGQAAVKMARGEDPPAYVGSPRQVVPGAIVLSLLWIGLFVAQVQTSAQTGAARSAQMEAVKAKIGEWKISLDRSAEALEKQDWVGARAELELAERSADEVPDPAERTVALAITRYRLALSYLAERNAAGTEKFSSAAAAQTFLDNVEKHLKSAVQHLQRAPASYPGRGNLLREMAGTYADFLRRTKRPDEAQKYEALAGRITGQRP